MKRGRNVLNKSFKDINVLQKSLEASWLRNQVISNNIANVNTPNYKRYDVEFEKILKDYISRNSSSAINKRNYGIELNSIDNLKPRIVVDKNSSKRKDGNNVDIDIEIAELTKNTIKINALMEQISSNLRRLRMAVTDGRK